MQSLRGRSHQVQSPVFAQLSGNPYVVRMGKPTPMTVKQYVQMWNGKKVNVEKAVIAKKPIVLSVVKMARPMEINAKLNVQAQ